MSKRAEQRALEAYPRAPFGPQNITDDDRNRQAYIKGYEQAEKDTIERIISYLGECDLEQTILDFDRDGYANIHFESLEKLIRKAMEDE